MGPCGLGRNLRFLLKCLTAGKQRQDVDYATESVHRTGHPNGVVATMLGRMLPASGAEDRRDEHRDAERF